MQSGNSWRSREGISIFEGNFAIMVLIDLLNPLHQLFEEFTFFFIVSMSPPIFGYFFSFSVRRLDSFL